MRKSISTQLQDLYGVEVPARLISNLTDAVEAEPKIWQNAKFWLQVLTELQNRGLKDCFIACCDLNRFAIEFGVLFEIPGGVLPYLAFIL